MITVVLLSGAVALHVLWNLLARHHQPSRNLLWWALGLHSAICLPWACYWLLVYAPSAVWGPLLINTLTMPVYFAGLIMAYQNGPAGLVYPLARSAPLPLAVVGAWWYNEPLSSGQWWGVLLGVAGLLVIAASSRHSSSGKAVPYALLATAATTAYSMADRLVIGHLDSEAAVVAYITPGFICSFAALWLWQGMALRQWRPPPQPPGLMVGISTVAIAGAYTLVVLSMRNLPAAITVSFANGGIVVVALLGLLLFNERQGWKLRFLGIAITSAGMLQLLR